VGGGGSGVHDGCLAVAPSPNPAVLILKEFGMPCRSPQVVSVRADEPVVVETEIGYVTSVDLSYEILTDE
jgi:hypothetical protein